MAELSNIVAGRVKHALVSDQVPAVLGLPTVRVVETGDTDTRPPDSLGVRFGVTGTDHELEIRLVVAARPPAPAPATPAASGEGQP